MWYRTDTLYYPYTTRTLNNLLYLWIHSYMTLQLSLHMHRRPAVNTGDYLYLFISVWFGHLSFTFVNQRPDTSASIYKVSKNAFRWRYRQINIYSLSSSRTVRVCVPTTRQLFAKQTTVIWTHHYRVRRTHTGRHWSFCLCLIAVYDDDMNKIGDSLYCLEDRTAGGLPIWGWFVIVQMQCRHSFERDSRQRANCSIGTPLHLSKSTILIRWALPHV